MSALAFDGNSQLRGMRVTEGQGIELVQALSKSKVGYGQFPDVTVTFAGLPISTNEKSTVWQN